MYIRSSTVYQPIAFPHLYAYTHEALSATGCNHYSRLLNWNMVSVCNQGCVGGGPRPAPPPPLPTFRKLIHSYIFVHPAALPLYILEALSLPPPPPSFWKPPVFPPPPPHTPQPHFLYAALLLYGTVHMSCTKFLY